MSKTSSLCIASLLLAASASGAAVKSTKYVTSSNVVQLTRKSVARSPEYLRAAYPERIVGHGQGIANVTSVLGAQVFITEIQFGSETFPVVIDSGSSDTWLVESGFKCFDVATYKPEAEKYCNFGPSYNLTKTFKQIPDENFNITYADGESLTGIMGIEAVTLGGITVKNQHVGLVNRASWNGDSISSGLMGLAFPAITSAYAGNNLTADNITQNLQYNPVFTNMYTEGLTAPVFSLALSRTNLTTGYGGVLALGGLPPIDFVHDFACAPIQKLVIDGVAHPYKEFYTVSINNLVYENSAKTKGNASFQVIIDSGTTLIVLPQAHADAINAQFDPPAKYDDAQGAYVTKCTAKVPDFAVKIGGKVFQVDAFDNILKIPGNKEDCTTGITNGGDELAILGDAFLKNVVAVFDLGAQEMRFAAHEHYKST